jgi:molecular chaperone GrpE
MEHTHSHKPSQKSEHDEAQAGNASTASEGAEQSTDLRVLKLENEIQQLKGERDDAKNRLLLTIADYQNHVRRTRNEVSDARQHELFETAKKLVDVLDQFDRALEVDPNKVSGENLLKGLSMVRAQFLQVFERMGVKRIEAKPGDAFDPKLHEALLKQPAPAGVAVDAVAAQLQPGYIMADRTVRPVKVSVAQ